MQKHLLKRYALFYAFLQVVEVFGRIDKSAVSRKIYMVLKWTAQLGPEFIKMPRTEAEMNIMTRCIWALDCTHVKIQSLGGADAKNLRNRKRFFHSSDLKFQDILCRWLGFAHDSNIFRNNRVRIDFENRE